MTKNPTAKTSRIVDRIAAQRAELEAQLQDLEAETQAHEAHLEDRLEKAGRARVALVEDLLDRFDIPQGTPRIDKETGKQKRTKGGEPIFINNDADETKRMARLAEVIDELVRRAEGREPVIAPAAVTPEVVTEPEELDEEPEDASPTTTFSSPQVEGDVAS